MSTYKTIQFKPKDIERIKKLAIELEKEVGVKYSQRDVVMYAITAAENEGGLNLESD